MKRITSLLLVLAASTPVFADDTSIASATTTTTDTTPRGYIGAGFAASAYPFALAFFAGASVDGGGRLGTTPLYLRGRIESGLAGAWNSDGHFQSYLAGIEARTCSRHTCIFGGVDAGLRRQAADSDGMRVHSHYGLIVPRVGFDVGGSQIRGRFGLELPTLVVRDGSYSGPGVTVGVSISW